MHERPWSLAAAGLVLLGGLARALPLSDRFVERRVGEVIVSADYAWPESLDKGWFPVQVRLENPGQRAREVQLRLRDQSWRSSRSVDRALVLAAGERVEVELIASALHDRASSYGLTVTVDGERTHVGSFGADDHAGEQGEASSVLVFAESDPSPGTDERRTAAISSRRVDPSGHSGAYLVAAIPEKEAESNDNIRVHGARFDQLARSASAYTSLDAVVLDSARGVPAGARTEPLVAWLRQGGTLCVFGPRAEAAAQAVPGLSAWMEPRFALGSWNEPGGGEVRAWRAGLGLLFVGESVDALEDASQVAALRWVTESGRGVVADASQSARWRLSEHAPLLVGLVELPYRAFAGLLLLFAILIGPLNFFVVKRSGRPVLLLLTIPAVALVASLGFLGYGILYQGLDVKAASVTFELLDQRTQRVSAVEQRQWFAGIAPAAGLRPGAGTTCIEYTAIGPSPHAPRYHSWELPEVLQRVTLDDGVLLSGDFLPSRRVFTQQVLVDRGAQKRLAVERAAEGFRIENALGRRVEELILRAPTGAWFVLASPVEAGETGLAAPADPEAAAALARELWPDLVEGDADDLPAACYLARLDRAAFADDTGVEVNETTGRHALLGVLPPSEGAWR